MNIFAYFLPALQSIIVERNIKAFKARGRSKALSLCSAAIVVSRIDFQIRIQFTRNIPNICVMVICFYTLMTTIAVYVIFSNYKNNHFWQKKTASIFVCFCILYIVHKNISIKMFILPNLNLLSQCWTTPIFIFFC